MNKKYIVIGVIVVVLIGIVMFYSNSSSAPQDTSPTPDTTVTQPSLQQDTSVPSSSTTPDQNSVTPSQSSSRPDDTFGPPVPDNTTNATAPETPPSNQKEFTVTGQNYSFSPSTITVKKGDTVKITFENKDGLHDFRIDELNVATKRINGGEQDVVTFTADKTGTFEYYCSVGNHRAMGMKGTLKVE